MLFSYSVEVFCYPAILCGLSYYSPILFELIFRFLFKLSSYSAIQPFHKAILLFHHSAFSVRLFCSFTILLFRSFCFVIPPFCYSAILFQLFYSVIQSLFWYSIILLLFQFNGVVLILTILLSLLSCFAVPQSSFFVISFSWSAIQLFCHFVVVLLFWFWLICCSFEMFCKFIILLVSILLFLCVLLFSFWYSVWVEYDSELHSSNYY